MGGEAKVCRDLCWLDKDRNVINLVKNIYKKRCAIEKHKSASSSWHEVFL